MSIFHSTIPCISSVIVHSIMLHDHTDFFPRQHFDRFHWKLKIKIWKHSIMCVVTSPYFFFFFHGQIEFFFQTTFWQIFTGSWKIKHKTLNHGAVTSPYFFLCLSSIFLLCTAHVCSLSNYILVHSFFSFQG